MKLKKIAALLLAGAMVVTSISYDAVIAEAKENSVSEDDGTDENYLNEDEEDVDEEDTDEEDIDEEDTDEEDSIYAYCDRSIALGESVTLTAQVQDSDGEPIDLDDYDFTYEWYRVTSSEEDGEEDVENDYEYLGSGREYFLDSVTEDDYMVGYECWIYDGDDVVAYTRYFLFPEDENGEYEDGEDEETTYLSCEVTVSALVGDSITLTPEFYDYENNLLDYTDPAYSYEWYKYYRFIEEGDTVSESAECVIDAVSEEDFFTEDNELLQYVCKVYKDGKVIAKTRVGIYNTKEVYTVTGYTAKAAQGGSITLTPKVTDYEGNTVDVEDAELKFYWSRYVDEGGQEYAGEGYKLTIDEVTSSDLYKDLNGNLLNNYYECTMIDYDHHG
jgi:hypothetical protein